MQSHSNSVFLNSCLRVPVHPNTKMPVTYHERIENSSKSEVKSNTVEFVLKPKEFFKSIPEYNDINHLSEEKFQKMLKDLREQKKKLIEISLKDLDLSDVEIISLENHLPTNSKTNNKRKQRRACSSTSNTSNDLNSKPLRSENTRRSDRVRFSDTEDDVDVQFKKDFRRESFDRQCKSMPSSPLKTRRMSPQEFRSTTLKPFNMTLRDEDTCKLKSLKDQTKFFSDDLLNKKKKNYVFKANPVPIESRILLYDKIMEDKAMRLDDRNLQLQPISAIAKLNSAAELQARMKPFSFTEREDPLEARDVCSRQELDTSIEEAKLLIPKRKFKARPVPKIIFSNYIYDKMREDEFFRSMKRKIRAEELLKSSSLPPSMAARERSAQKSERLTPATKYYNSESNSDLSFMSKTCIKKVNKKLGSPYKKKTVKRSCVSNVSLYSDQTKDTNYHISHDRVTSRPNLAALLRVENTKKKIEEDLQQKILEKEFQSELKWKNFLRKKPAWELVKNNSKEDIASRLHCRREEEKMLKEQFMHEMELMYDRVKHQPLLFERYYYPVTNMKNKNGTKIKSALKSSLKSPVPSGTFTLNSPTKERKVSINATVDANNERLSAYFDSCTNTPENKYKTSDSNDSDFDEG